MKKLSYAVFEVRGEGQFDLVFSAFAAAYPSLYRVQSDTLYSWVKDGGTREQLLLMQQLEQGRDPQPPQTAAGASGRTGLLHFFENMATEKFAAIRKELDVPRPEGLWQYATVTPWVGDRRLTVLVPPPGQGDCWEVTADYSLRPSLNAAEDVIDLGRMAKLGDSSPSSWVRPRFIAALRRAEQAGCGLPILLGEKWKEEED